MKQLDRVLLLATGLLAAYQIVVGVNGADAFQFLESRQTDPIRKTILTVLPGLLLLMTAAFVGGLAI